LEAGARCPGKLVVHPPRDRESPNSKHGQALRIKDLYFSKFTQVLHGQQAFFLKSIVFYLDFVTCRLPSL
jgi:hypothetical protein